MTCCRENACGKENARCAWKKLRNPRDKYTDIIVPPPRHAEISAAAVSFQNPLHYLFVFDTGVSVTR
jgi:hypothetical protein